MLTGLHNHNGNTMYKVSKGVFVPNYLSDAPCGVCSLLDQCSPGGIISPSSCVYFAEWLSMAEDAEDEVGGTSLVGSLLDW